MMPLTISSQLSFSTKEEPIEPKAHQGQGDGRQTNDGAARRVDLVCQVGDLKVLEAHLFEECSDLRT
jgi:hypothetical protein